jgi:hypothetical protein
MFVAACAVILACQDSTAPAVTVSADLESLLAESISGQSLGGSAMLASGVPFIGAAAMPRGTCGFDASSSLFVCPRSATPADGITSQTSFQLLDGVNTPLRAYDAAKIAAIRTISDVNGTMSLGSSSLSISVTAHNDATLSGLLPSGAAHALNATGTSDMTLTTGSLTSNAKMSTTIKDLVLPRSADSNPYPVSGTITTESVFDNPNAAPMRVIMTFNGTSVATVAITTRGATQNCTMDLSHRPSFPVCPAD